MIDGGGKVRSCGRVGDRQAAIVAAEAHERRAEGPPRGLRDDPGAGLRGQPEAGDQLRLHGGREFDRGYVDLSLFVKIHPAE